MRPFTVISTPSNTGSPFEADEGGRAHRGYEVGEGVRDGATSPLLAALQDRPAQGSPAEDVPASLGLCPGRAADASARAARSPAAVAEVGQR